MKTVYLLLLTFLVACSEPQYKHVPGGLVQAILDENIIAEYLHPELPDRIPLRILNKNIAIDAKLTKFNQAVIVITGADDLPYIEISRYEVEDGVWTVEMLYAVEGISAKFIAHREQDNKWNIVYADLVEH